MDHTKLWLISSAMYCKNKPVKTDCDNQECDAHEKEFQKCLCISKGQIVLITVVGKYPLVLEMGNEHKRQNVSPPFDTNLLCKKPVGFAKNLVACSKWKDELLQAMSETEGEIQLDEILKCVPVVQCVNTIRRIDDRNTICYLALFDERAPIYIKEILREIALHMVWCYEERQDGLELTGFVDKIFLEISEIFEKKNFDAFGKRLATVIEQYSDKFSEENTSLYNESRKLEKYRKEFSLISKRDQSMDAYDFIFHKEASAAKLEREIFYLRKIIDQISKMTNIKLGSSYDSFFQNALRTSECPHDDYDKICKVLQEAGDNTSIVLMNLKMILEDSYNLQDEEKIEEFVSLCNCA